MKFINWPRSTLMRFAALMPRIIAGQVGTIVNTAGLHEMQMAPFAYWDATFQGWLDQGFKNSGKNRMLELIREYGGPAELYYGIMDTQGLEVLMTRKEWKAREKYWLKYCIDNGKWPFSVWLVPKDIEVLEGIADNKVVTELIDKMRFQPVKKHTLEGWKILNPAEYGFERDEAWKKLGATGWQTQFLIDGYDVAGLGYTNFVTDPEQRKMEFLFPWNLQMRKIEELTVQSYEALLDDYWEEMVSKDRFGEKRDLKKIKGDIRWNSGFPFWSKGYDSDVKNIHNIYNQILQEYEMSGGKLVGFGPYPEI